MDPSLNATLVVADTLLLNMRLLVEDGSNLMLKSEFEKIEESLKSIQEVIRMMVEVREVKGLSHEQRLFIGKCKYVIYDVDDLLDEFITRRKQNHTRIIKLVICGFPGDHRLVKEIQKKCRYAADSLTKFDVRCNDILPRIQPETCPYVYSFDIIGRERDVNAVLDMLLSYDCHSRDIGFVSIVGMGGIGKTTLAQLVFNSPHVAHHFELRLWVCISDMDSGFDFEAIIAKILEAATGQMRKNQTPGDNHNQLLALLRRKRFLLVLDDVWSENVNELRKLRHVLMTGGNGSRILATTRSMVTANMMADTSDLVYYLHGLSEADSLRLFQLTTFNQLQEADSELVEIGKNIVARCSNHPLALKVVGSILYGQNRHKWLAVQQSMMDNSLYDSPDLMSIIKLSYDQLSPPLKCCFTYCALFPKGFKLRKDVLVSLWMAQGYIPQPPTRSQSVEDVADTYFKVLLERCFFQDAEIDECGDVVSCRIHDLMHDLALSLAGEEIWVEKSLADISSKALHVFHNEMYDTVGSFGKTRIRTYLQSGLHTEFPVATLISNCKSLRALALHDLDIRTLPDSIGKLLHLRYLGLSRNKRLEKLPRSLTKLCYLETLELRNCSNLEELPSDLSKLVFLRCLDILGCKLLTRMPANMNKLSRLCTLTLFVMDEGDSGGKLEDLKALHKLKGSIEILIPANYTISEENEIQGECLREMTRLKAVSLHFRGSGDENRDSTLLEKLQPHQNLKSLSLKGYQGSAVRRVAFVKNLVKLELKSCEGLIHLSFLNNLVFLESLILCNLVNLEYMEDASSIRASPGSNELACFPSLKYLSISGMCKLQRWWGNADLLDGDLVDSFRNRQLSSMSLSLVDIQSCPELVSFPACLNVEKLCLTELNTALSISDLCPDWHLWLKELKVDHVGYLKPPSQERGQISTKLRKLYIGGLQRSSHVNSEESLRGSMKWDSEDDGPWKLLHESLQELVLDSLEKMVNLPKGMQHLTALQHLYITHCNNLKVIPEWISCLTSLETLYIISCTGLKSLPDSMPKLTSLRHLEIQGHTYLQKRCQPIHGEDWLKIQHIPSITFQDIS